MNFEQSGLPKNKLVEDAFNYSHKNILSRQAEAMIGVKQQFDMMYEQNLEALNEAKEAGQLTEAEYKRELAEADRARQDQLRIAPMMIRQQLEIAFINRLGPVKTVVEHAEQAPAELLAAMLLVECVRSPVDHRNIAQQFGQQVADTIAEIVHIDVYPSERASNLAKASPDVKRASLALVVDSLEKAIKHIEAASKANPGLPIMAPPGQEERLYSDSKPVWGNDKKLDARFVEAFNKVSKATSSAFTLEVDTNGGLDLVKSDVPKTQKPGLPKGPKIIPPGPKGPGGGGSGSLGGDVF